MNLLGSIVKIPVPLNSVNWLGAIFRTSFYSGFWAHWSQNPSTLANFGITRAKLWSTVNSVGHLEWVGTPGPRDWFWDQLSPSPILSETLEPKNSSPGLAVNFRDAGTKNLSPLLNSGITEVRILFHGTGESWDTGNEVQAPQGTLMLLKPWLFCSLNLLFQDVPGPQKVVIDVLFRAEYSMVSLLSFWQVSVLTNTLCWECH